MNITHSSQPGSGVLARPDGCVLVAEEDGELREEIISLLKYAGFTVRTAANAEGALAILVAEPEIAVVLSDLRMPSISGISLTKEVRATRTERTAVEVVLLTAFVGAAARDEARQVGAFGLLSKPASVADIVAAVRGAMICANSRRMAAVAAGHSPTAP